MNENKSPLAHPIDAQLILRKKVALKKKLLAKNNFLEIRIAIVGGSTTSEIKNILELFLLDAGIKPNFFEGEYNQYFEELFFENKLLKKFNPEVILIHTTEKNIKHYPIPSDTKETVDNLLKYEIERFQAIWQKATQNFKCTVIQNNFEFPLSRPLGNLDCSFHSGKTLFINSLNKSMVEFKESNKNFYINDINYLASWLGLERWHNLDDWTASKYALGYELIPYHSLNLASIIKGIYGKNKKGLILDMDNTLWGGVIGDDGIEGIKIGTETAVSESYLKFQRYILELKSRGIMLSVASKNDIDNALNGLSHKDSLLSKEDFISIQANWNPKPNSISEIAKDLNIGLDSLVFIDDNPSERDIVRQMQPAVSVPDVGADVNQFIKIIDKSGLFESHEMSSDDISRNSYYEQNQKRDTFSLTFEDYSEYLKSLKMVATIENFKEINLSRITQLVNKTNQFNLTTKRYSPAEIEEVYRGENYIALSGRLQDKFGDNGLISIIIGSIKNQHLKIELWVMSCRVIKREMEYAMFESLIKECTKKNIKSISGKYIPSLKNNMVKNLYQDLGFKKQDDANENYDLFYIDLKNIKSLPVHQIRIKNE